jgi:RimJ/RimL family protein N-acetyltransferase
MQTENLYLRRFTLDDAEAFWPLVSMPEILRYTGEQPQASIDEVRNILGTRPLRDYATFGYGRMACIEKSSGRLVGFSGLKFVEELNEVDIGYRFLPDCWGKGYATESARVLVQHGADQYGIRRVIGLVQAENVASARVLGKLGLAFERTLTMPGDAGLMKLYAREMRANALDESGAA